MIAHPCEQSSGRLKRHVPSPHTHIYYIILYNIMYVVLWRSYLYTCKRIIILLLCGAGDADAVKTTTAAQTATTGLYEYIFIPSYMYNINV